MTKEERGKADREEEETLSRTLQKGVHIYIPHKIQKLISFP